MKIDIKATNLELTEEIKDYLNKKIGDTDRFIPNINFPLEARVELARTTIHHQTGDIFRAEITMQMPGKVLRTETEAENILAAIDELKDEIQREIKEYKEKSTTKTRKAERLRKFLTAYSPFSRFKK
jgi:putative sigma-54 modulation protein